MQFTGRKMHMFEDEHKKIREFYERFLSSSAIIIVSGKQQRISPYYCKSEI